MIILCFTFGDKFFSYTLDEEIRFLPYVRNFYVTQIISPKVHSLVLNVGCKGPHVTLVLNGHHNK